MQSYSVFGGHLRSALAFPELRRAYEGGPADWTLERASGPLTRSSLELLGEDQVDVGVRVRLHRLDDGFRLDYDDTGSFEVLDRGARIVWRPDADAQPDAVRLDVLGRVLPTALHAAGALSLHGSAVALDGAGIAFLAPKHHGKSTLAQAMVERGALLASDDVVPVLSGPPARMRPGVPSVRLWSDALAQLAPSGEEEAEDRFTKRALEMMPEERVLWETVPLAAIYLLRPRAKGERTAGTRRSRLDALPATIALLAESKLGPLLGRGEAPKLLEQVTALVRTVPVYTLEITRGWELLPQVVETVNAWHTRSRDDAVVTALR